MKYRTEEQFIELMENAINGNWNDAFRAAEEGGFYSQDLLRHYENIGEEYGFELEDLVHIAEGAQRLRR